MLEYVTLLFAEEGGHPPRVLKTGDTSFVQQSPFLKMTP